MFNLKWGVFAAAGGFALALILSLLVGHTSFPVALLRAGIFGALFFGLGTGVWALINTFIPELFIEARDEGENGVFGMEQAGSRVNITVDDSGAALPNSEKDGPDSENIEDFNDLVSGAIAKNNARDIDQNPVTGYNESGIGDSGEFAPMFDDMRPENDLGDFSIDFGAFAPGSDGKTAEAGAFGGAGGGGQAGSDSLMDSFSMFPSASDSGMFNEAPEPERKTAGNKNAQLEGDFNAKDIAAGIRTVLEKDKRG